MAKKVYEDVSFIICDADTKSCTILDSSNKKEEVEDVHGLRYDKSESGELNIAHHLFCELSIRDKMSPLEKHFIL